MAKKTDNMSPERLRSEAYFAYLDGRVKRARELNSLAAKREREAAKAAERLARLRAAAGVEAH